MNKIGGENLLLQIVDGELVTLRIGEHDLVQQLPITRLEVNWSPGDGACLHFSALPRNVIKEGRHDGNS